MDDSEAITEISDSGQILRLLEKAVVEEYLLEVQINQRTRIFFSCILDHPPDLEEMTDADGTTRLFEPPYRPLSYLRQMNRLVIAPLDPPLGNALIRSSSEVLVRFFQGVRATETTVAFQGVLLIRGDPALSLTFPRQFRIERKRRHFRAEIPAQMGHETLVQPEEQGKAVPARLMDISASGLAFLAPEESGLAVGQRVRILVKNGEGQLELAGTIRNQTRAPGRGGSKEVILLNGVQLDVLSTQLGMRIDELVAAAQRLKLQTIMSRRTRILAEDTPSQEETGANKKPLLKEEILRFFKTKGENQHKV